MKKSKSIYLDNGATSWPKPKAVARAVENAINNIGANPGRSGYARAHKADELVYKARKRAAAFFGLKDASRLIFTPGATYSINIALKGLLKKGDSVIVTGRQHNAVSRPIMDKEQNLAAISLTWDGDGPFPEKRLDELLAKKPKPKAVAVNHASNVDGLLFPIKRIASIARRHNAVVIVDAAQTAGYVDIDMAKSGIDILCAPGHKGLWGPSGIGILAIGSNLNIPPLIMGGTGSYSEEEGMPTPYPDRLEAGSLNLPGIAGLDAGIKEVQKIGIEKIASHKASLCERAFKALSGIKNVKLYWPKKNRNRVSLFSFNIVGADPSDAGDMLDRKYGIACRVGLHCSPSAHKEIGTFPEGSIRFSPGYFTKKSEIDFFIKAVSEIAGKRR